LKNGEVVISGGLQDNLEKATALTFLFSTIERKFTPLPDMLIARYHHCLVECGGSVYAIGGLSRGKMPIKMVEAFDLRLATDWRRCKAMFVERSEFGAVVPRDSKFIYVFGGTMREEDQLLIERYDTIMDEWEMMGVRLPQKFNIFTTFYIGYDSTNSPKKKKSTR